LESRARYGDDRFSASAISGTAAWEVEIVRTGSRGLYWLEPMIEVATAQGRIAYCPVGAADVEPLFDAGFLDGGRHPLRLGRPEELPFLKRQTLSPSRAATGSRPRITARMAGSPGARDRAGTRCGHRGDRQIRIARPRRCRFSDRHQMADDGAG